MVALGKCEGCRTIPVVHCYGSADRPAKDGKIGGFRCSCPCRDEVPTTASGDEAAGDKDR